MTKKKDRYVITETFTASVEYEVYADSEDQAMSLYEAGEYKEYDVEGHDRYDYIFQSIKKEPLPAEGNIPLVDQEEY